MPQEYGPSSAAWRRYRLWSWAFWIVFVGYLPAMAFVARVLGAGEGNAIFLAAFVWMIWFALVGYQKGNFRCPRCGSCSSGSSTIARGAGHGSTIRSLAAARIAACPSGPPWISARHRRVRLDLKYLLKIDLLCFDGQLGVQPVQTKEGP